jgi:molybdopterin molybdotransferase
MTLGFWRVALRPGKPLMHGRLGRTLILGLPGNPVSSIVCALLFLLPAIRALQGDPSADRDASEPARLGADLAPNDARQDYMRAALETLPGELPTVTAHARQDSSMLTVLARSDALIVRAPLAPAVRAGDLVAVLRLDRLL